MGPRPRRQAGPKGPPSAGPVGPRPYSQAGSTRPASGSPSRNSPNTTVSCAKRRSRDGSR
eukprot:9752232-Alexandrium_andersonii.AAC.1